MAILEFSLLLATLVQAVFPVGVYARQIQDSDGRRLFVPQEDIDEEHGSHSKVSKVPSVRVSARAARRHDSDRRLFKPQEDEPDGPLEQLDLGAAEQERAIGDAINAAVETQGPFR
jgi:hypothetical protein